MTCDLEAIAAFLSSANITSVALESTGVYWKPLFSVLNKKGFEVYLVNARQTRNVSGRKTDETDAMCLPVRSGGDSKVAQLWVVKKFLPAR